MIRSTFAAAVIVLLSFAAASSVYAGPTDTPGATPVPGAPSPDATGKPGDVPPAKPKKVHHTSPKQAAQQQKMKNCSADAKTKGLTGADRKTYMSTCLKN